MHAKRGFRMPCDIQRCFLRHDRHSVDKVTALSLILGYTTDESLYLPHIWRAERA